MTTTDNQSMTVFDAINEVSNRVGSLAKDGVNLHQKYNFRGIDQLVTAVQPVLNDVGVAIVPTVLEYKSEDRVTADKIQRWCTVLVKYTIHGPAGDTTEAILVGEANDTADKAMNKALSNAAKYFYFQTFWFGVGGMDDGDLDHNEAAPRQYGKPAQMENRPAQQQTRQAAPASGDLSSEAQQRKIWAMAHKTLEWNDSLMYDQIELALGERVADLKLLTKRQASVVIEAFQAHIDNPSALTETPAPTEYDGYGGEDF